MSSDQLAPKRELSVWAAMKFIDPPNCLDLEDFYRSMAVRVGPELAAKMGWDYPTRAKRRFVA